MAEGAATRAGSRATTCSSKATSRAGSLTCTDTFRKIGLIIDGNTAFIMTSNFTRSALGGYSGSSYLSNREYDIIDTNAKDVQAVIAIFNADWNHSTAQFNDPNLVVSPVNSRNDFNKPPLNVLSHLQGWGRKSLSTYAASRSALDWNGRSCYTVLQKERNSHADRPYLSTQGSRPPDASTPESSAAGSRSGLDVLSRTPVIQSQ